MPTQRLAHYQRTHEDWWNEQLRHPVRRNDRVIWSIARTRVGYFKILVRCQDRFGIGSGRIVELG